MKKIKAKTIYTFIKKVTSALFMLNVVGNSVTFIISKIEVLSTSFQFHQ